VAKIRVESKTIVIKVSGVTPEVPTPTPAPPTLPTPTPPTEVYNIVDVSLQVDSSRELTINEGETATFNVTVTIDKPAKTSLSTIVNLIISGIGTIPLTVTIPERSTTGKASHTERFDREGTYVAYAETTTDQISPTAGFTSPIRFV